jgi:tetratricopeptide (TPR) repeat protein
MSSPSPPNGRLFLQRWGLLLLIIVGFWWFRSMLPSVPPQVQAGEAALKAKDLKKAEQQFDAAIKANPTDPNVYINICQACILQKNATLAIRYGEQAVTVFKDEPRPVRALLFSLLSQCYAEEETAPHQEKTVDAAQRAYELDPDAPEIMNGYGYVLADNNRKLDEAIPLLKRALELLKQRPNLPETRKLVAATEDSYGWALYKQGNDQDAQGKVSEAQGSYSDAVSALSQALTDLANSETEEAKMEGESLKAFYYHMGAACHKAGRLQEARNMLGFALRYDPNYAPAKAELESLPPPASPSANSPKPGAADASGVKSGGEDRSPASTGASTTAPSDPSAPAPPAGSKQ